MGANRHIRYEHTLPTLIPKSTSYAFAVPDMPSNIRFEGGAGADGLAALGGALPVVKGGTLNKLVRVLHVYFFL